MMRTLPYLRHSGSRKRSLKRVTLSENDNFFCITVHSFLALYLKCDWLKTARAVGTTGVEELLTDFAARNADADFLITGTPPAERGVRRKRRASCSLSAGQRRVQSIFSIFGQANLYTQSKDSI
jgi:hypothetical protein